MPRERAKPGATATENVGAAFLSAARRHPNAEALVMPGARFTYQDMLERARLVAAGLRAAGLKRGDCVWLLMENSVEYLDIVLGAILTGIVPVLLGTKAEVHHLASPLAAGEPKAVFVSRSERFDLGATVAATLAQASTKGDKEALDRIPVWMVDDRDPDCSYREFLTRGKAVEVNLEQEVTTIRQDEPLAVVFTAAVTSLTPKICRLTHRFILCKIPPFLARFEMTSDSRLWLPFPMFQVAFLSSFLTALAAGATVIASRHFDADEALALISDEHVTHANPIYLRYWLPIIHHLEFRPSQFPALSHACLIGPVNALRRAQRALPQCVVMSTYGSAEVGGSFCFPNPDDPADIRLGSVGRPFPGHDVRIVDPATGRTVRHGSVGEIQLRGIGVPQPTQADQYGRYTADGWLRTSDLGALGPDGELYYHGRLSEVLTIGHETVSALHLETLLMGHPDVAMAQVIGRSDERLGQVAAAFVELRPGSILGEKDLIAYCHKQMKAEFVPRYVMFVTEWPTSASKIFKPALAEHPFGPRLVN